MEMRMKKVQILMSTYNGQTYLKKQIESILAQTYPNIELSIRDDGSKDRTVEILKEYEQRYENINVVLEKNIGVTASFFSLIEKSNSDYIAFADQDDIWLPQKIEVAVQKLEKREKPALYACNKVLIDKNDDIIKENNKREKQPSFSNALVESICTGCTIVMNKRLVDLIKGHIPDQAVLHDWWCYLLSAYIGDVIYDKEAYIWYRQHGGNVVGASDHIWGKIKYNVKYILKNRGKLGKQLNEFHAVYYGEEKKDKQLQRVIAADKFPNSLKIAFSKDVRRQNIVDEVIMRVLFVLHLML